ncbi:TolC family protein [Candidatus Neomarinimicrobiota bacterium]
MNYSVSLEILQEGKEMMGARYKAFILCNIIILIISCNTIWAQQNMTLTHDEAINIALRNSYTVKSSSLDKEAMESYYDFRKRDFMPRFNLNLFSPSWNEQVSPVEVSEGLPVYNSIGSIQYGGDMQFTYFLPTGGNIALSTTMYHEDMQRYLALQDYERLKTNQAYTSLSLIFSQPIFTNNTLKQNLDEAKYEYELASYLFTRGQIDIIYQVTEGFYRTYRATQQVEIDRERLNNAEEAYRIAELKGKSGRIPESQVLVAKIGVAQSEAALFESKRDLEREKDYFKQLIGLALTQEVKIIAKMEYDSIEIDIDKAIKEAINNRPELFESSLHTNLQEISLEKAKQVREFKGNISAYYDLTGISASNNGNTSELIRSSFENFTERPPNRGINLSFSFPISDWGRGNARIQQAEADLRKAELTLQYQKIQVEREVRDVVRMVNGAYRNLKVYDEIKEMARRNFEVSFMQFENGDITSQDLALEQERLANSQINYLDAFIKYQLAAVDLKRKTMWDFENNRSYMTDDYFKSN